MKKIIKIITIFFLVILVLFVIDFFNNNLNKIKFERIKTDTHLNSIIADWGYPDKEFIYKDLNNSVVYKYKKDLLGWETYVFIFSQQDSLLISKDIDD